MNNVEFKREWIDVVGNDKTYQVVPKRKSIFISKAKKEKRLVEFKDGQNIWTGVLSCSST